MSSVHSAGSILCLDRTEFERYTMYIGGEEYSPSQPMSRDTVGYETHIEAAVLQIEEVTGSVKQGGYNPFSHVQALVSWVFNSVHEDVALLRVAVEVHVQHHLQRSTQYKTA